MFDNVNACMTERGWPLERHDDGSIGTVDGVPDEQYSEYRAAFDECLLAHDSPPPALDSESAGRFYDALIEQAECLETLGHSVSDPPSRELSVQSMIESEIIDPLWDPMGEVIESGSQSEIQQAFNACPNPLP